MNTDPLNRPNGPLTDFLYWWLAQPIGSIRSPEQAGTVMAHENVVTIVLFRRGQFQVELVLMLPDATEWPGEHRHPNVDSYEVSVFNTSRVTKNGVLLDGPELLVPVNMTNGNPAYAMCVRILPTDWHGTKRMPIGSSLFSVQHWLNGVVPTSVGLDWIGEPTAPGHAKQLEQFGNSGEQSEPTAEQYAKPQHITRVYQAP